MSVYQPRSRTILSTSVVTLSCLVAISCGAGRMPVGPPHHGGTGAKTDVEKRPRDVELKVVSGKAIVFTLGREIECKEHKVSPMIQEFSDGTSEPRAPDISESDWKACGVQHLSNEPIVLSTTTKDIPLRTDAQGIARFEDFSSLHWADFKHEVATGRWNDTKVTLRIDCGGDCRTEAHKRFDDAEKKWWASIETRAKTIRARMKDPLVAAATVKEICACEKLSMSGRCPGPANSSDKGQGCSIETYLKECNVSASAGACNEVSERLSAANSREHPPALVPVDAIVEYRIRAMLLDEKIRSVSDVGKFYDGERAAIMGLSCSAYVNNCQRIATTFFDTNEYGRRTGYSTSDGFQRDKFDTGHTSLADGVRFLAEACRRGVEGACGTNTRLVGSCKAQDCANEARSCQSMCGERQVGKEGVGPCENTCTDQRVRCLAVCQ